MGWEKGDLALHVRHSPCGCCGHFGVPPGSVNRVEGVTVGRSGFADQGQTGLFLEGVQPPHGRAFNAKFFRKITPGAKIEGVEERRRIPTPETVT